MKKERRSFTAEAAAMFRAATASDCDPAVRNPDYLAARLMSPPVRAASTIPVLWRMMIALGERLGPDLKWLHAARTRHFDRLVLEAVEQGVRQLVILAAGLDSRAYRLGLQSAGVHFWELDHPSTQAVKRTRVRRALGALPSHVTYAAVDLTRTSAWDVLSAHGFDRTRPSFILWEGCTMYLDKASVTATLTELARSAPGTAIAFDYLQGEALRHPERYPGMARVLAAVRQLGEDATFALDPEELASLARRTGLTLQANLTAVDLAARYLVRSDGTRCSMGLYWSIAQLACRA